jgi:hypothetical protein
VGRDLTSCLRRKAWIGEQPAMTGEEREDVTVLAELLHMPLELGIDVEGLELRLGRRGQRDEHERAQADDEGSQNNLRIGDKGAAP